MKGKTVKLNRELVNPNDWEVYDVIIGWTICVCGTSIKWQYHITHKETAETKIIGSTCATKTSLRSSVLIWEKVAVLKKYPEMRLGYVLRKFALASDFLNDDDKYFIISKNKLSNDKLIPEDHKRRIQLHKHIANNFYHIG